MASYWIEKSKRGDAMRGEQGIATLAIALYKPAMHNKNIYHVFLHY